MGLFKDSDDDPSTGSGRGGTTGTPSTDTAMAPPPGEDSDSMVVSGGGVADTSGEDGATGAGERGLG